MDRLPSVIGLDLKSAELCVDLILVHTREERATLRLLLSVDGRAGRLNDRLVVLIEFPEVSDGGFDNVAVPVHEIGFFWRAVQKKFDARCRVGYSRRRA